MLADEERTPIEYRPELFEWTQFNLPEGFDPNEVLARVLYIEKYMSEKEGIDLIKVALSENQTLSAVVEQLEDIPYPKYQDDLPEDPDYEKAKELEAEAEPAATPAKPQFEVRILKNPENGELVAQFKLLKGDVIDFQEIYRKMVRIMAIGEVKE